jgi:hypothetical protein
MFMQRSPSDTGYFDTYLKVPLSTPSSWGLNPVTIQGLKSWLAPHPGDNL